MGPTPSETVPAQPGHDGASPEGFAPNWASARVLADRLTNELGDDPDAPLDDAPPFPPRRELSALPEVPPGAIVAARDGARAVAVARLASGRLVVVDDVCPHDGGPISDGFVDGDRIVCARHGWELVACGSRCERAHTTAARWRK